jgi:GR25 family glycosyltransferase involved in LPS biosynthesis
MVKAMNVTKEELDQNQLMAGFIGFEAGSESATKLFDEAFEWGSKKDCLFGSNFVGKDTIKPWGHRHDQSILSILQIRHRLSTVDGHRLACVESMRKTHQKGSPVYLHRGTFTVHRPVLPGIDDVWMVSLDRRADRYSTWKATYPELPVNRLPAIDGKMLELSQNLFSLFEKNDFQWKKSVAGCALSHILLWAQLASEQPFVKNYLILEDDQRFARLGWKEELAKAMTLAPTDADLLYLGGVLPGNMPSYSSCLEPVNDVWATIKPNNMFTGNGSLAPVFHFCAYAYILTRQGAQKLLRNMTEGGCRTSIDHYLGHPYHGLKKYVMRDLMATCFQESDPAYRTSEFDNFQRVDTFDSDIWNNKDCFSEFEEFAKGQEVSLWDCIADVLVQAPHSIQTRNTLQRSALTFPKAATGPIVYYYDRKDGQPHDGTLEERWIRSLWSDFVFRPLRSNEPFVPGSWLLMARPNMNFWQQVAEQLNRGKVPFQILHLSDEFSKDPVQLYKLPLCKRVVRNYSRVDVTDEKVVTIPLGFAHGYCGNHDGSSSNHDGNSSNSDSDSFSQWQKRTYIWSFHGTNWFNRGSDLKPLERLIPHSLKLQQDFLDKDMTSPAEYRDLLKKSQFIPVPRGNSPETYRFYEALENGCIPLYVRSEGDDVFWNWIRLKLPLVEFRTWTDAYTQCQAWTTTEGAAAQTYRTELLNAWNLWKNDCKKAFVV